jgi:hypothetical protein
MKYQHTPPSRGEHQEAIKQKMKETRVHGEGTIPNAAYNEKERSFGKISATLTEEGTQVGVRVPSPK